MFVKICGVTTVEDALAAVQAGADAVGVNLVPSSPRRVSLEVAREIALALGARVRRIGVVADVPALELESLRARCGLDLWQLCGKETPEEVRRLLPDAFKSVRIGGPEDVVEATRHPGDLILVDTKVPGALGGTGQSFDWTLVRDLARRRRLVLAGGLSPENVARAITEVRPWGVDVASGVEVSGNPRRKDPERMQRFVQNAHRAWQELA